MEGLYFRVLEEVIAGSNYNRCWYTRSTFSKALESLFLKQFIIECLPNVPSYL